MTCDELPIHSLPFPMTMQQLIRWRSVILLEHDVCSFFVPILHSTNVRLSKRLVDEKDIDIISNGKVLLGELEVLAGPAVLLVIVKSDAKILGVSEIF